MPGLAPLPVLRHAFGDQPGFIQESLERFRLPYTILDLHADASQSIRLREAPALIVLGGPMSVNQGLDFLERERQLIAEAISMDKPVLGICLGSQLMATALGERVYPIAAPEIGWFPVRATSAAAGDRLFHDWGLRTVFHWHNEGFDLPAGAVLLASSDRCANQAFRYGDRHWAVQFHPEVTPSIVASWCRDDDACGAERELAEPVDPGWNAEHLRVLANTMFDRWAQMVIELS